MTRPLARSSRRNPVIVALAFPIAAALAGSSLSIATASAAPASAPEVSSVSTPLGLDLTGDGKLTSADVAFASTYVGAKAGDASWGKVKDVDLDGNGTLTLADIAALSQRVLFDDGTFDLVEADVEQMQAAMNAGVITAVELTERYLERIKAYDATVVDTSETGRALHSIIATSDQALEAAAASDAARAKNGTNSSLLDGIPILLKDNYDTLDMPTTGGCSCWEDNLTETDATMVAKLREQGAIILGKASLDEFAYGFSSEFSTGSEIGSSKLVASPYNTAKTAGGSSGGTGAAIAANLGAIGFGTDTGGSIRVPSGYNQLVGIRPTVGLTSRDGIIPLALSQDTGGPMARTVTDAAIALEATVGTDPADEATAATDSRVTGSYAEALDSTALAGTKIGYLTQMTTTTNATANRLFAEAIADLEARGAEVVPITIDGIAPILGEGSGSTNEFKAQLNDYVEAHLSDDVTLRTLSDIIESNKFTASRKSTYVQRDAVTPETYDTWMTNHTNVIRSGNELVTSALDSNDLSALIYPSNTTYGTWSTNMRLSPNTGMPAVTVPMGQSTEADGTVANAGVNLEFLGRSYDEATLIGLAYDYEQATEHRTTPALYGALAGDTVAGPGTTSAAAGTGKVALKAPATVTAGQTFTVTLTTDAADLYASTATIGFNPKKVTFKRASTGSAGNVVTTTAASGKVSMVQSRIGTSPGLNGSAGLVTLSFTAQTSGAVSFTATGVTTIDTAGTSATRAVASAKTTLKAKKTSTTVKVKASKVKVGKKFTVTVRTTASGSTPTGKVKVTVRGVTRTATLTRGTGKVTFTARGKATKKGTKVPVVVRYLGDSVHAASTKRGTVTLVKK